MMHGQKNIKLRLILSDISLNIHHSR